MNKLPGYEIKDGDIIYDGEMRGNVIPMEWLNHIKRESGNVDTVAVLLLSDIVYWYRPIEVRDEETGRVLGYRKRYKADKLQRSYDYYAELCSLGKSQVRRALKNLERLGLIEIEYRTIITKTGVKVSNVTYISLNIAKLKEISGGYQQKCLYPYQQKCSDPIDKNVDTNTEITTENTLKAIAPEKIEKTDRSFEGWLEEKEAHAEQIKTDPPHSAEEAKARTRAALERSHKKHLAFVGAGLTNVDLSFVPERLLPYAERFVMRFGRCPTKNEQSYWLQAWDEQIQIGLTPDYLDKAFDAMRNDGLTIKSPASLTSIAWDLSQRDSETANYTQRLLQAAMSD